MIILGHLGIAFPRTVGAEVPARIVGMLGMINPIYFFAAAHTSYEVHRVSPFL